MFRENSGAEGMDWRKDQRSNLLVPPQFRAESDTLGHRSKAEIVLRSDASDVPGKISDFLKLRARIQEYGIFISGFCNPTLIDLLSDMFH